MGHQVLFAVVTDYCSPLGKGKLLDVARERGIEHEGARAVREYA